MCQKLPMRTLKSTMNTKVEMVRPELCPKQMLSASSSQRFTNTEVTTRDMATMRPNVPGGYTSF
jgi:hypothetical protein